MLVIRAYHVLSELHLSVCSTAGEEVLAGVRVDQALGTASRPLSESDAPRQVCELLHRALSEIDGYAGDLIDHLRA